MDIDLNQYPLEDILNVNHQPAENPIINPLQNLLFDLNQPAHEDIRNNINHEPVENVFIDLNQIPPQNILTDENQNPRPKIFFVDLNQNLVANPHETMPQPENIRISNKKKNLSVNQKRAIIQMLIQESRDGILPKGVIAKVAIHFSVSTRSVSRLWNATKESIANDTLPDTLSKMVKIVGRKRVEIDVEAMKSIPFRRRTNIRSLANALGLGKSTVHRRIKEGSIRPHSNPVKPYLTDNNKKLRMEFCLSMIDKGMDETKNIFFNMHDRIHIDEKWFYMTKTSQKYYLYPHETESFRTCKRRRFVPKIMFLAAVARPRFDVISNNEFGGKIGIWPFVFQEPAKRNSKNRVAGTMETKPITSVTKDVIRSCLIKICCQQSKKWPSHSNNTIFIQQDNARPHIDAKDVEFLEAAGRFGLDVRLCSQPANSPDLNVLDLGFFRAIDSLTHQEAPSTIDEFVSSVEKAFDMFPNEELNNVFLTLQACMVEILKNLGGNNYKIPHMNKKKLIRDEQLPVCLECDTQVLNQAEEFIRGQES